ncbi:unnamed protein product [marine sediment metagenome]|uniref:Uncharacterized protein n=1 Tax=marine sediment metagenome TaxID=412755 RepID=X1QSX8_9ZZZZ
MDIYRSTYYYKPKGKLSGEAGLRDRIEKIAYKYPYYGHKENDACPKKGWYCSNTTNIFF